MSAILDWTMLHAHFEKRLIERTAMMRATLETLEAAEGDLTRFELERQFHSLAGIAGTYGYPDITDIARRGELLAPHGTVAELRDIVESLSTD
jgi:HPt (histidine-containing phosphotransfer) domain-containing protein